MNAEIVYQVVKALPKEEQKLLFDKLKSDFEIPPNFKILKKVKVFNNEEATKYLLKSVFRNIRNAQ